MPNHTGGFRRRAQELRKNATPQEKHLWYDFLSKYPSRFRRQVPFSGFIVDFYCAEAMLAVEVDGEPHYTDRGLAYDAERTSRLEAVGIAVIRFENSQVEHDFDAVCEKIHNTVILRKSSLRKESSS